MPKSSSQLKTFEEADAALRALGEALRDKARLEIAAQKQIDSVKARLAENRIGPDAVVKSTTKLLGKFIERHQADIEARGGKTVQLQFGRIGTRTAPPALKLDKGFTESDCIHWLRTKLDQDADAYIQVIERLRRDDLKLLDEDVLNECGMSVSQEEILVIEPAVDVAQEVA